AEGHRRLAQPLARGLHPIESGRDHLRRRDAVGDQNLSEQPGFSDERHAMLQPTMLAQWVFVAVEAAADVAGAAFVTKAHQCGRAPLRYLVDAGAGFMLAAEFVSLLPECMLASSAIPFLL